MADLTGRVRFPLIPIQLNESQGTDTPEISDVQLMRVGTFFHEKYGEVNITSAMLAEMVKNFSHRVRNIDLAIDYKHESEDIAAGWIQALHLSDDGQSLWATVKWTPRGRKVLSDREFRYLSADFVFQYQDNETLKKYGPTLFGAGLTNRPVIKGMEPAVPLSEKTYHEGDPEMSKDKKAPAAPVADDQDVKKPDMDSRMAKMEEMMAEMHGKLTASKAADAEKAPLSQKVVKNGEGDGQDVMDIIQDLQKRIEALEKGEEGEVEASEKDAMVGKEQKSPPLSKDKPGDKGESDDEESNEAALSERHSQFNVMLAEGKVCESQREPFLKGNMKQFAELGSELTVKLSARGHGKSESGTDEVPGGDAQDKVMSLANRKLAEKKVRSFGEGVSAVLSENPKLRQEYEAAVAVNS